MMKIREETENLAKQTSEKRINVFCLQEDKARAKFKAKVYADLESELTLLNIVLQMNLRRLNYEKVITDILRIKRNNEDRLEKLESLFDFKQRVEEKLERLRAETEQRNSNNNPSVEFSTEEEECLRSIDVLRGKIEKTKQAMARYSRAIEGNFFKTKRRQLLSKLKSCVAERDALVQESDPEIVLKALREDKETIRALGRERKEMEEALKQLHCDLETIGNIEASAGTESNKLEDPEETFKELRRKQDEITTCLDYLLLKKDKCGDFYEVSESSSQEVASEEAYVQHVQKLQAFGEHFQKQLEDLSKTYSEKISEVEKYRTIDKALDELSENGMSLEEQKSLLQLKMATLNGSVEALKDRLKECTRLLEKDDSYKETLQLDEDLQRLEFENSKLQEAVISEEVCEETQQLSREIDELVCEHNEKLIRRLKGFDA